MRKVLLIAMAVLTVGLGGLSLWAQRAADSADRAAERAAASRADLEAELANMRAQQAEVTSRSKADVDAAATAEARKLALVERSGLVQRRLEALARASLALTEAQAELTKVTNQVVDLLNDDRRDEAGALLEGAAREREADVTAALAAERRAATGVRRAVAIYRRAAR